MPMTPEQSAAYVNAMTAGMLVEMEGMKAENAVRTHRGEAIAYDEGAFSALVESAGIHRDFLVNLFKEAVS